MHLIGPNARYMNQSEACASCAVFEVPPLVRSWRKRRPEQQRPPGTVSTPDTTLLTPAHIKVARFTGPSPGSVFSR
ncbi:hypothetical protein PBY51_011521 [Eleginops maclovinus]|uniref:Uncharacterized protein n=1 Tax=Eleginops maclovinus TaxID=56733 RepID=A0AAN8ALE7_ELEMC|nr:hypothetical protein PBY51_011521 [Eleginops maclovinus]